MSYETRYAAQKQAAFERRASSPEAAADRLRCRAAMERAKADALARFGPVADLPDDKVDAFLAYREERYYEHYAAAAAPPTPPRSTKRRHA